MQKLKSGIGIVIIVLSILLLGILIWWFYPYFFTIRGFDFESGYEYKISGSYIYLLEYNGTDKIVHVPTRMKGRKVEICPPGFSGSDIEEAYVAESVCMRSNTLQYCDSLHKFVGSSNKKIVSSIFSDDTNLEEVYFPNKIEKVEQGAFYNCKKIKKVEFLKDVKIIELSAFYGTGIEELPEMNQLEYVGYHAFEGTPWLEEQTEEFVALANTLIRYNGTDENIYVPEGVTAVSCDFNKEEMGKTNIYLPNSVKRLEQYIFMTSNEITIYIPSSVDEIEKFDLDNTKKEDITIATTAGSYAETYAKENGIKCEIVEDWN